MLSQTKPFFALNYIVSAKLAMLLCMERLGLYFYVCQQLMPRPTIAPISSTQVTDMTITAQNQSIDSEPSRHTNYHTTSNHSSEADGKDNSNYAGGQVTYTNNIGFLGNKDFLETPFSAISYTDKFIDDQQAVDISDDYCCNGSFCLYQRRKWRKS